MADRNLRYKKKEKPGRLYSAWISWNVREPVLSKILEKVKIPLDDHKG